MKTIIATILAATFLVACGKKEEAPAPAPVAAPAPAAAPATTPAAADSKPEEAKK